CDTRRRARSPLFPYTTLFRSWGERGNQRFSHLAGPHPNPLPKGEGTCETVSYTAFKLSATGRRSALIAGGMAPMIPNSKPVPQPDRKSTRLNSTHVKISYAVL